MNSYVSNCTFESEATAHIGAAVKVVLFERQNASY